MIGQALKLGEQLIADGVISPDQLAQALAKQQTSGKRLGVNLVDIGAISAQSLVSALAERLGFKGCVLRHGLIDPKIAKCIPKEEAERLKVLPMFRVRAPGGTPARGGVPASKTGVAPAAPVRGMPASKAAVASIPDELTVAMVDPQSLPTLDRLRNLTGCRIRPVLVLEENLEEFQKKYLAAEVTVDAFLASIEESSVEITEQEAIDEGPVTDLDKMVDGSPVINLVNLAILTAMRDGASDIHIEPDRRATHIRYRIDGQLRELLTPPKGMHAALVSRIKVIGRMDIAEKRLPQEGRVHLVADGREIDLRVSAMPTILGEKIVIRILDQTHLSFELGELGVQEDDRGAIDAMLKSAYGMMLVSGPTGSGKTTTLYSALDLLRNEATNILTVEDPVEYQLTGINQIQVNEQVGLTFSRALRSILRQDPDVIMVGEIRDEDTARVAVQAALTGHLVLSTLHTNDGPGAIARLTDMGVEPYLISASMLGVVAQRLARTVCKSCKTSYYPAAELLELVGWRQRTNELFQRGEGCRECHNTGFRGRVGIYEVMVLDAELKRLIQRSASESDIRLYLAETGWRTLREKALDVVERGESTLEEVLRVTRAEPLSVCNPAGETAEATV